MKEVELVNKLIEKNYKIATAESCTGGMLVSTIVNVPNASKVLDASFITYANDAKIKFLNVDAETISKYGVVSKQVAIEMAKGVAKNCNANIGVGITGIAGPTGATKTKPVGTVCFGFYIENKTYSYKKIFNGDRTHNRKCSVNFAINTLLKLI